MRPNAVFSLSISTLIAWLLVTQPGFGVPEKLPPDVLELRPAVMSTQITPVFSTMPKMTALPLRRGFI